MIYLVEDDDNIRELQSYALKNSGFDVRDFSSGEALADAMKQETPQLILLDIMLPGEDGLAILRRLRGDPVTAHIPVILVTAKTGEMDKVKGLDFGADDYIAKPFGVMELISRVKAVLRRAAPLEHMELLRAGGVTLDCERREVLADGAPCALTYKEFELLRYFMENRGLALSRDQIMLKIWGYDFEGESRTVDMHVKTLRQKLGGQGALIKTIRNVGYKLEADNR